MSIKSKLLVTFLATALIPILILAGYTINQATSLAYQRFDESGTRQVQSIESAFSRFFVELRHNVEFLSQSSELKSADDTLTQYMNVSPNNLTMTPSKNGGVESEIYRQFENYGETHPGMAYVYMGTKLGGYVQWPEGKTVEGYDPRKRPWYQTAMKMPGKTAITGAYYWAADDATLVGIVRSFQNDKGEVFGVTAMDISLKGLTEMARKETFGEEGYLMVVEDSGTVLVDARNSEHNFKNLNQLEGNGYSQLAKTTKGNIKVRINDINYRAIVVTSPSLGWKVIGLMPVSEIMAPAYKVMWATVGITAVVLVIILFIALSLSGLLVRPIRAVSSGLKEIAQGEGDLTQKLPATSRDETGELARWFNSFIESIRELIGQVGECAHSIKSTSERGRNNADRVDRASENQLREVEALVAAVSEMSATANDVARNCAQSAESAQQGQQFCDEGGAIMRESVAAVNVLNDGMGNSVDDLRKLAEQTQQINSILDVIRGIAEQTNLLALNAAIEAARAGDQGRGFAVVADEVRQLAQRTQTSTTEIADLLDGLNDQTEQVVTTMSKSRKQSQEAVELSQRVAESFAAIERAVHDISDMTTQIASAAEEQHLVTEGVNRNIVAIHEATAEISSVSSQVAENAADQATLSSRLDQLVNRFKT